MKCTKEQIEYIVDFAEDYRMECITSRKKINVGELYAQIMQTEEFKNTELSREKLTFILADFYFTKRRNRDLIEGW